MCTRTHVRNRGSHATTVSFSLLSLQASSRWLIGSRSWQPRRPGKCSAAFCETLSASSFCRAPRTPGAGKVTCPLNRPTAACVDWGSLVAAAAVARRFTGGAQDRQPTMGLLGTVGGVGGMSAAVVAVVALLTTVQA
mmetsp:Transcript_22525/g.48811  ORF Transcript_22525/g.48811 Transcript_22525/m.48811 type:complete len:137 (-) Transcript_22525:1892-2302(-)